MDLGIFTLNQTYGLQNQGADVHFWSSQYSEVLRSGNFVCRSNWEARPNWATLRSGDLPLAYSFGKTVSNSFKPLKMFEPWVQVLQVLRKDALCSVLVSQMISTIGGGTSVHLGTSWISSQRSVVQCLYFPSGEVRRLFGLDLCHCSSAGRGEVFCSVLWNSSQNPLLYLGQPW